MNNGAETGGKESGKTLLLLVEDDQDSAQATANLIEKRDIGVTSVATGEAALSLWKMGSFDIIVSDIRLPGMSGVDLLKHIRKLSPEFPVILITGYDSLETAVQAVRLGAQDYILKPLNSIQDLLIPVMNAVAHARLLKRYRDLEESLVRARRFESVALLAGGIAHDLGNLVLPVMGYAGLVAQRIETPMDSEELAEAKIDLEQIRQASQGIMNLVRDLSAMSRGVKRQFERIDVNAAISLLLRSMSIVDLQKQHPKVQIGARLKQGIPQVLGAETMLLRILMNLTINAFEATKKGGRLEFATDTAHIEEDMAGYEVVRKGEYVTITVSDSGDGIKEELLRRVFEPFISTKTRTDGVTCGLGLMVVFSLVKEQGGFIDVKSEHKKGTTFTIYLPIPPRDAEKIETAVTNENESVRNIEQALVV
jgi:signal transduction histidine kinase